MFTGSSEQNGFRPLAPGVSRVKARARLGRRRRWFAFRSESLRLELIRLPVYIVEARFAPAEGVDSVAVRVAVDALNGSVERIDRGLKLKPAAHRDEATAGASVVRVRGRRRRSERRPSEGIVVPPSLSTAEALSRARSELPWLALHFALRRGTVYTLVNMDVRDRVGYPYWILHTVRQQRRDFRALDGISGKKLGSRGRSLVVQGYILLARQEGSAPPRNPVEGN